MGEKKVYVITSGQAGALPNREVLASMKAYATERDSKLSIIPLTGKRKDSGEKMSDELIDYILQPDRATGIKLNDKIRVKETWVRPQQILPATGIARFTQRDVSTVIGNPKQFTQVVPNSNRDLPKILVTTGAVTRPNYAEGHRISAIAELDHTYGFVVVETDGPTKYHFRHVTALKSGAFVDLGTRYNGNEKTSASLEAMVLGDWHCGDTDPEVRETTFNMFSELKPKRLVIHDFFNGSSISHHEEKKSLTKAVRAMVGYDSVEDELKAASKEMFAISEAAGKETEILYVVGNHDEFLDRWVNSYRWLNEPKNAIAGAELFAKLGRMQVTGEDPIIIKEALKLYGGIPENVTFLPRGSDYKVYGWQLAEHGDKGASGARPSPRTLEDAFGKVIVGHRHMPGRWRNVIHVGTSTKIPLPYAEAGPGGWMHTHALLYHVGGNVAQPQLINIIDGKKWKL
jgi:hypothetical protein